MNNVSITKLEITRMIIRITTVVFSAWFIPLAFFTPWSSERIVEDYVTHGYIYTVYRYDIYLALAYILPVIGLWATNRSVKQYLKRLKAEPVSPVRMTPVKTVSIVQGRSDRQQSQHITFEEWPHCIICGKPHDSANKYCSYCGNQL